jgi:Tol biopolymer transport system component
VFDRDQQRVTFESAACGPTDCYEPDISPDGRYLVFRAGGTIIWRDTVDSVDRRLGDGRQPSITGNGLVFFTAEHDIYTFDPRDGLSRRVSIVDVPRATAGSTWSFTPSPSADGRYVAFASRKPSEAGRLESSQLFVRDTQQSSTMHIGSGWTPSLSGDGSVMAFVGLAHGLPHIYVNDLRAGTTRVISRNVGGGLANGASANPAISADGRFVAFQSEASDLVRGEDLNLLWDVFVYDRDRGTIVRVSGDPGAAWMEPSVGPAIDGTGSVIAFSSRHPTRQADERNDFDLYVATMAAVAEGQKIK